MKRAGEWCFNILKGILSGIFENVSSGSKEMFQRMQNRFGTFCSFDNFSCCSFINTFQLKFEFYCLLNFIHVTFTLELIKTGINESITNLGLRDLKALIVKRELLVELFNTLNASSPLPGILKDNLLALHEGLLKTPFKTLFRPLPEPTLIEVLKNIRDGVGEVVVFTSNKIGTLLNIDSFKSQSMENWRADIRKVKETLFDEGELENFSEFLKERVNEVLKNKNIRHFQLLMIY